MKIIEPNLGPSMAHQEFAHPWVPDLGDGTYRNPVLHADYSDPDVIRHGDNFYLTASSFNCTPGLPLLHSRDLVNWTLIGHALKNVPGEHYRQVQPGWGVWAPSIRFHAGKFWIFFSTPDEGIYFVTAHDPRGPWSEPHLVQAGKGLIDPCPHWDDDGNAYLVHAYAGSRAGIKHRLRVRPMAPDGLRLLGEGEIVFHKPDEHPTLEGPKFLKRDGWYYIFAPAGGVATGWQLALRSRNIYGPYEERIILETGGTQINGPHQGAMIDTPGGDWWFMHFQDAGIYGRIIHLQPVTWKDGWPQAGQDFDGNGIGEPVTRFAKPAVGTRQPVSIPASSDEFDQPRLGFQWQWLANHSEDWCSLTARPGWLRLIGQRNAVAELSQTPNLLLQKLPARTFEAETLLEISGGQTGDEAGLVIAGKSTVALSLRTSGASQHLVLRTDRTDHVVVAEAPSRIRLRASFSDGGLVSFAYATVDGFIPISQTFQAIAGVWIGAKIGIYCLGNSSGSSAVADFDFFRFAEPEGFR